ncbi:MAG: response regulator transcription factor [Lachnospiraceae bacterium]|nr:response regulator transcription factor [Lachnospiraceae bacterium]
MYKIMLVEDDRALAEEMKAQIESWGNEVILPTDFQNIIDAFNKCSPHLVLLDIVLPFYNGHHWCKEIRKISNVPIVYISSSSDNMNIVTAMNMGGDDFIPKPVDPMVMMAKIQAILRRVYDMSGPGSIPTLSHKGAVLNLDDGSITWGDERIELTKNEFRILQILMENKGKIVSREKLMTKLWQDDCYVEENTLTVNVNRVRKKLEAAGLPGFITTKVGSGYIIE